MDAGLMAETNQALSEAGLTLKNEKKIRHMVEVLLRLVAAVGRSAVCMRRVHQERLRWKAVLLFHPF